MGEDRIGDDGQTHEQVLFHLSNTCIVSTSNCQRYKIFRIGKGMVGEAGLEPTTPGLEGRCSIQLSYSPVPPLYR